MILLYTRMQWQIKIILLTIFSFLLLVTEANSFPGIIPSHNIKIEFDLKNHTIDSVDRLKANLTGKDELTFLVNKHVSIRTIREISGKELHYFIRDNKDQKEVTVHIPAYKSWIEIEIHYSGRFSELPGDVKFSREFLSDKPVAYAGEEMILLDGTSCWYPCVDQFTAFNITTVTPSGYEVVMEGTRLSREEKDGVTLTTWDFPHPVADIYLVGGKYVISEDNYNNISIYTYFFPEDTGLSQNYIDYSKKYLELYERLFGKYPFKKFAVVENILPTGFGMPSYTLLGQTVLRLPFMVKTSLGHEIAHNWWGNYVYPDYKSGNWSEGLTTYVADYLYDEMEGMGPVYRNQLLRDYTNYIDHTNEYPLTRFVRREKPGDRAIGYGKGAYVFHMLRVMLGDELFYKGLRDVIADKGFKVAAWDDFRTLFEKVSGKDLRWFFKQWVEEGGAPQITLGDVKVSSDETYKRYIIKAEILQKDKPVEIYLPVSVETESGSLLSYHWIKNRVNTIEIKVPSKPESIIIDPNYDVFRRLNPEEIPPAIGRFIGAKERLIIVPPGGGKDVSEAYMRVASILEGGSVKIDKPLLPSSIKIGEFTISVNDNVYDKKDAVLAVAVENPHNKGTVILFLAGEKPEYIISAGEKLSHYGKYSYLLFVKGENMEKGILEAEKLRKDFHENN